MSTNDDALGGYGRPPKSTRFKPGQSGNRERPSKGGAATSRPISQAYSKSVSRSAKMANCGTSVVRRRCC